MNTDKCLNYNECSNMIYENDGEYNRFQKMKDEIAGFVLPKRCKNCRVKAKAFFDNRREEEANAKNPDFVVGSKIKKFPDNSRGEDNQGQRYGY